MLTRHLEVVIATLAVTAVILWSLKFQAPLTVGDGFGWDGVAYASVARQCGAFARIHAEAPFGYRIGVPCLTGLVAVGSLLTRFLVVNLVGALLSVLLLFVYLARHVKAKWARIAMLLIYVLSWSAPLRMLFWSPAETPDQWMAVFLLLGLFALESEGPWIVVVSFISVFFREVLIVIPLAAVARRPRARELAALFCAVIGYGIVHVLVVPTNHWGAVGTMIYWAYAKSIASYVHAVFIAFGPVLAVIIARPESARRFLGARPDLMVILFIVAVLAYVGGSDTDRFFGWLLPLVLVIAGKTLSELRLRENLPPLAVIAAGQVLAMRVGIATPDGVDRIVPRAWPLFTPLTAERARLIGSLTPDIVMGALSIAEYGAFILGAALWLHHLEHKRVTLREAPNPRH